MYIEADYREYIPLEDFELGWRFEATHNPEILPEDKKCIFALSETESKRLNKIIDYYEAESNLHGKYIETGWFMANAENDAKVERFRVLVGQYLHPFEEDLIISWSRRTALKTTKAIFLKYWDDFLYPGSDNVTVISQQCNWILFYSHYEVADIWLKNK